MIDRQHNNYTPQIIKKSNFLIEKSNNLSFCTQNIFNLVLFEIQKQGVYNQEFKIPAYLFIKLMGIKKVYRTIEFFDEIGKKLIRNIVELVDKTEHSLDLTNLITRFKLENGFIHIKITDEFRAFADLDFVHADGKKTINKGYTAIDLNITSRFKNKHSIPLYEYSLMKLNYNTSPKHIKDKSKTEQFVSLETLKLLLCKDSKSYDNVNLFKYKVLNKAVAEINNKGDLDISYTDVKAHDNKTIIGFNFSIQAKELPAANTSQTWMHKIIKSTKQALTNVTEAILDKAPHEIVPEAMSNIKEDILDKIPYEIISQPVKQVLTSAKEAIVATVSPETLPQPIQQALSYGYRNKKQLLDMYHGSLDRKGQIIAIIAEISTKYAKLPNDEKCRLIAVLIQRNACYKSIVEIEQEQLDTQTAKEKIHKQEREKFEQHQQYQQEKIQRETIQKNNREVFEHEIAEGNSQLAEIWQAITKIMHMNLLDQNVKTWFNPAIAKIEENTLNILLPNHFKFKFFKENLVKYVDEALQSINLNINVKVKVGI